METKLQHPTRAMAVANWFLIRSKQSPEWPACDQMKIYKLVYYAQAWFLGNCGEELFPEDIEAWPHGPVVRDLYIAFNRAGRNPITFLGTRLEMSENVDLDSIRNAKFVVPEHDGSLDEFFEAIWQEYGDQTGIELSNGTHSAGEPWTIVAENYDFDLSRKPTIPSEVIQAVFAEKVASG